VSSNGVNLAEQPIMFWLASSIYLVGGLILIAIGAWRLVRQQRTLGNRLSLGSGPLMSARVMTEIDPKQSFS
jgi:hypothetical protein